MGLLAKNVSFRNCLSFGYPLLPVKLCFPAGSPFAPQRLFCYSLMSKALEYLQYKPRTWLAARDYPSAVSYACNIPMSFVENPDSACHLGSCAFPISQGYEHVIEDPIPNP